jgi:hypothetical protein
MTRLEKLRKEANPGALFVAGTLSGFLAGLILVVLSGFLVNFTGAPISVLLMFTIMLVGLFFAYIWEVWHGFGVLIGGFLFLIPVYFPNTDQFEPDQVRYRLGIGPGDQELIRKFENWEVRLPPDAANVKYFNCSSFFENHYAIYFELDSIVVHQLRERNQLKLRPLIHKEIFRTFCWPTEWGSKLASDSSKLGHLSVFTEETKTMWPAENSLILEVRADGTARGQIRIGTY